MCEVGDVVERYLVLSRVRAAGAVQSCTNEAVLAQATACPQSRERSAIAG